MFDLAELGRSFVTGVALLIQLPAGGEVGRNRSVTATRSPPAV